MKTSVWKCINRYVTVSEPYQHFLFFNVYPYLNESVLKIITFSFEIGLKIYWIVFLRIIFYFFKVFINRENVIFPLHLFENLWIILTERKMYIDFRAHFGFHRMHMSSNWVFHFQKRRINSSDDHNIYFSCRYLIICKGNEKTFIFICKVLRRM